MYWLLVLKQINLVLTFSYRLKMTSDILGVPAVRQVIYRLNKNSSDEQLVIDKLERSCRKFDHKGKGKLTVDEYFNVIKLQNGIDISKAEVLGWMFELISYLYDLPQWCEQIISNVYFMKL